MLDESCSLRLIHVQNFGSCCTSCQMWYANTMKVMSSYFRNYRSICQDTKKLSVISSAPISINIFCCPLKVSEQRDIHPQCCCNGIADDFSEGKPLS